MRPRYGHGFRMARDRPAQPRRRRHGRVLRLAVSYNAKSGQVARLVWPASWTDVVEHDFEDLAAAFLPWTREQMAAIKAERDASWRSARPPGRSAAPRRRPPAFPSRTCSRPAPDFRRYWPSIVAALDAVRVNRWGLTPPEGKRDTWAFLSACAIAQAEGGDDRHVGRAPRRSRRAARGRAPDGPRRPGAHHAPGEAGETSGDAERAVGYVYSKARNADAARLSEDDARADGARCPPARRRATFGRQRSADRRTEAGATPRIVTVSARLADGREPSPRRRPASPCARSSRPSPGVAVRRACAGPWRSGRGDPRRDPARDRRVAPVETASETV